jgi:hypothetical protein
MLLSLCKMTRRRQIYNMNANNVLLTIAILGFVFALIRTAIAFRKWQLKVADRRNHAQDNKILYIMAQIKQILDEINRKIQNY